MSLGSWPASRVALYALVWLVGFPLVMGLAGLFTPYNPERAHWGPEGHVAHAPVSVETRVYVADTMALSSVGGEAVVALSFSEEKAPVDWMGWFLPPALFVGAWALARRRRTDGD